MATVVMTSLKSALVFSMLSTRDARATEEVLMMPTHVGSSGCLLKNVDSSGASGA